MTGQVQNTWRTCTRGGASFPIGSIRHSVPVIRHEANRPTLRLVSRYRVYWAHSSVVMGKQAMARSYTTCGTGQHWRFKRLASNLWPRAIQALDSSRVSPCVGASLCAGVWVRMAKQEADGRLARKQAWHACCGCACSRAPTWTRGGSFCACSSLM